MTAMTALPPLPDVNINELQTAWDLSRNGLKARAKALGVELLRPSPKATYWPAEYVEAGHDLDRWIKSGKTLSEHPAVISATAQTAPLSVPAAPAQSDTLLALVTAINAISHSPAVTDPLAVSQSLANAAENDLALTGQEMAELLGKKTMHARDDGSEPRPGYRISRVHHRTKAGNKKLSTFWVTSRV